MTRRRKVVVLCEDLQSQSFVRRALKAYGFDAGEIVVEPLPSKVGGGAGHAWVAKHYPRHLAAIRKAGKATSLVAHIDADDRTVAQRHAQLREACTTASIDPRTATEPVAELVPRRNIETWIYALDDDLAAGVDLNENEPLPKLAHEGDCRHAARAFAEHARQNTEPETAGAVPSLLDGIKEFRRLVPKT